jgi:hypothetical protein
MEGRFYQPIWRKTTPCAKSIGHALGRPNVGESHLSGNRVYQELVGVPMLTESRICRFSLSTFPMNTITS